MALQTEPHSCEAEKTVLGAVLLNPDCIHDVLDELAADDFYDPIYREIFAAMESVHAEKLPTDFVIVANALSENKKIQEIGGSAFLASLAEGVPTSSHVMQYAGIVKKKSKLRQYIHAGQQLHSRAREDGATVESLRDFIEGELLKIELGTTREDDYPIAGVLEQRYKHFTELHDAEDKRALLGIELGFRELDEHIVGLCPGDLNVVAGRPGMGKTAFAQGLGLNVARRGFQVSFTSFEMTKEQLADRFMAAHLGVDVWTMLKGHMTQKDLLKYGKVIDDIGKLPWHINDNASCKDLSSLRSYARRRKALHGLDLLIVDYIQLMRPPRSLESAKKVDQVTYFSEGLKDLARELGIPILAVSQLSRAVELRTDKRPQLSDLRESGSIEQDASVVMMLFRDDYYNEQSDRPGETDILIRKNRQGKDGCVTLRFHKPTMTFDDML